MIQKSLGEPEAVCSSNFFLSSIPTNASSLSDICANKKIVQKHQCQDQIDCFQNQEECTGDKIIKWLRSKEIIEGNPYDLMTSHREQQKRVINEKLGDKLSKPFVLSSSLLTRRLSKIASTTE